MAIKLSLSVWLAVFAMVTLNHGDIWPQILLDVGDNPDSNTAPLSADLNSGLDPDTIGPNGWTALHIAAGLNKPEMAKILKDKGAKLDIQDVNKYTPLHLAAGLNHANVINKLLPGANTEIKGPNQWTPLHVAAGNGNAYSIYTMSHLGADTNAVDSNGDTPLHIAVGNNHLYAATALLDIPGTNINAQDNNGYTPLHIAARNNLPEIASALLRYGASPTIVDNNGETAKQVAAYLDYTNTVNIIDAS